MRTGYVSDTASAWEHIAQRYPAGRSFADRGVRIDVCRILVQGRFLGLERLLPQTRHLPCYFRAI